MLVQRFILLPCPSLPFHHTCSISTPSRNIDIARTLFLQSELIKFDLTCVVCSHLLALSFVPGCCLHAQDLYISSEPLPLSVALESSRAELPLKLGPAVGRSSPTELVFTLRVLHQSWDEGFQMCLKGLRTRAHQLINKLDND